MLAYGSDLVLQVGPLLSQSCLPEIHISHTLNHQTNNNAPPWSLDFRGSQFMLLIVMWMVSDGEEN